MSKIIIWNKDNFLIAELDGKIQKEHDYRIVKFKEFKLMKSQSIKKQIRKIEAVIKYSSMKLEEREEVNEKNNIK